MTIEEANDCISRQALRNAMYHEAFEVDSEMQRWDGGCWIRYKLFETVIDNLPSVQLEQKAGTWKAHEDSKIPRYWHYSCSVCGCEVEKATRYCSNCGAMMKGERCEI